MTTNSVFADFEQKSYPHRFAGQILVHTLCGGTPTDPKVAEGWIKTKLAPTDDLLRSMVADTMAERGVTVDEAAEIVADTRSLTGFKRDDQGLYIEGRQLKAALKEAISVAVAAGKLPKLKWGATNKAALGFLAEHVFILEDRLHLGVAEPSGVAQRFVQTWTPKGPISAIKYEEYVTDAKFDFTVVTDHPYTDDQWAAIWTTGEKQGIGASRSQGFGTYAVTRWDRLQ